MDSNLVEESDRELNRYILLGIIVILLLIIGIVIYRRKRIEKEQLEELEQRLEEERAITAEVEDLDFEIEKPKLKAQIDNFVDKNPELVAQLIRAWLNE